MHRQLTKIVFGGTVSSQDLTNQRQASVSLIGRDNCLCTDEQSVNYRKMRFRAWMLEHPRTNLGQNVQRPEMQLNCASFRNDPPQPSRKQWRPFAAHVQTAQTRFRTVNLFSLSERSVLTQFNNISEMFSTKCIASLERAHSQEYSDIYLYMSVSSLFCKK